MSATTLPSHATGRTAAAKQAVIHRMVVPGHTCPYGLKALHLLRQAGYEVEDRHLTTRDAVETFKAEHGVATTPQVFVGGERIGGHDDLRRFLGKPVADPKATTYRPVAALFALTALTATAASYAVTGSPFTLRAAEWFIGFSMVVLALLKLQDIERFSTMFLNYDLLAQRWVPYAKLYPCLEAGAGVLMVAGALTWLSAPVALFIGTVGAVSVFKAVYLDRRELKCACVGGASNVPLGFVSLTENLMMVAMALWMLAAALGGSVGHTMAGMPAGQATSPAAQAYMAGMERMGRDMGAPMSGDADRDFAAMMIPHHAGAIDMAKVELQHGRDPILRGMAQEIIAAQEREIAELKGWLANR